MGGKELDYIKEAFEANYISPLGEQITKFEEAIKNYTGVQNALAVVSGTSALHLALRVLNISKGDLVFASSMTFIGGIAPVLYENGELLFIDSEIESWNISYELLEDEIKRRKKANKKLPKVLIATHIYGQSAKIKEISELCKENGIYLIEDGAEALGAKYEDKAIGTFGDLAIYSFNGNKIITSSGGGMLVSANSELIAKAKFYSTQAKENHIYYEHLEYGYNYRMSNIVAGIGRGQMEVLDLRIKRRREIFDLYKNEFSGVDEVEFMPELPNSFGNRWLTVISFKNANPEKVRVKLEEHNIESRPVWKPMHLQPLFKNNKSIVNGVSEKLFNSGLCLPSGTAMSDSDIKYISDEIKKCL